MKKNRGKIAFFALVMIWALSPTVSQAQYWMRTYGHLENYYLIRDSTEAFFSADTSRIKNSVYGFKHFQRWKTFLESRVDENGTLATYHQNLAQEYENILLTDDDRTPGQWNSLGPVTGTTGVLAELGIVTSLLVIDDQNIYAGTGTAGLFVTNNGGATWRSLTDKYLITGIESIIKTDPNTIYIATGFDTWGKVYGKGILKSEDNGLTWKETGLNSNFLEGNPFTVKGMIADPDSSGTFYALVQEEHRKNARIVKSVDAGVTWDVKDTLPDIDLRKIEMDPTNSNSIMASGRRVVLSNDKGESWHDITTRIPYYPAGI